MGVVGAGLLDRFGLGAFDEVGVGEPPFEAFASLGEASSALARRAFSAAMSITPSSGMTNSRAGADLHGRAGRRLAVRIAESRASRSSVAALDRMTRAASVEG